MEQGFGADTVSFSGSIDKSRVLNVKPMRCLVPIFPSPQRMASQGAAAAPFVCVPPAGPFPSGIAPFYPFFVTPESHSQQQNPPQTPLATNHAGPFQSPAPISAVRPISVATGHSRSSTRRKYKTHKYTQKLRLAEDEDNGNGDSLPLHDDDDDDVNVDVDDDGQMVMSHKRTRSGRKIKFSSPDVDRDAIAHAFLEKFDLAQFDMIRCADGDRESVEYILMMFNLLRLKFTQKDDGKDATPGMIRRPDLRVAAILLNKGVRTNVKKRIGVVPGIEVGDIFFFRMELCLIGLHAPSMAGIDYMGTKKGLDNDPVAVSIVSSGGYEDNDEDGEVLIYSGQGGIQRRDGKLMDQKLERGNLALEQSSCKANAIRVIRGIKDVANPGSKVYVYDGLYKIQDSWIEKGKAGCNVFKYKLHRLPGQPEAFMTWKSIQQWKDGITTSRGVILPDLTSGAESLPVSLVNDVDDEKGPAYFLYVPAPKYSKPMELGKVSARCACKGGCHSGDPNCQCIQKNGGHLAYVPNGVLADWNSVVHECGPSCACPTNCRNRVSQAGLRVHLEVFKTKDKGWGLRSWDPIRAGAFICVYAGEVIDLSKLECESGIEDNYLFDSTRIFKPLEIMQGDSDGDPKIPVPLVITSKNCGNVARFMNHGCSPNVFWRPVLSENNNEQQLHVAFYAARHIPPMVELTYDYGIVRSPDADKRRKRCLCGSVKCRDLASPALVAFPNEWGGLGEGRTATGLLHCCSMCLLVIIVTHLAFARRCFKILLHELFNIFANVHAMIVFLISCLHLSGGGYENT
ncbi:SET domain [Dillenia turbinata]|uniref:SET domain n=1 Tax=Dillenia turbinata TaxID=194707 RepID=A0AAN8WA73_9MAGN